MNESGEEDVSVTSHAELLIDSKRRRDLDKPVNSAGLTLPHGAEPAACGFGYSQEDEKQLMPPSDVKKLRFARVLESKNKPFN